MPPVESLKALVRHVMTERIDKRGRNLVLPVFDVSRAHSIENSPILDGKQTTTFRSGTMRCAYLARNRVDVSEAIKCLARAMSKPRAQDT